MHRSPFPSVSTRTDEFTPRELPLLVRLDGTPAAAASLNPASDRIRETLRRWLEEEL
jgi:hypothetical protein